MILDEQDQKDLERYREIVRRKGHEWRWYAKAIEFLENGKTRPGWFSYVNTKSRATELVRRMLNSGLTANQVIHQLNLSCDCRNIYQLSKGHGIKVEYMQEINEHYNQWKRKHGRSKPHQYRHAM